jgi:hypothetical protein
MRAGVSIRIVSDTATPALREQMAELTPERFAARVGPKVAELTETHLAGLGGNVKGYPSTRFYEKFARNVRWLPQPNGVAVTILPAVVNGRQVGLGLRVFGGTITPQTVDRLAIPISPISYGHVPSDFPNLFLLKTVRGAYLCQRAEAISEKTGHTVIGHRLGGNAGRRIRTDISFLFKLVRSVTQAGNRDVLPGDEQYLTTALSAVLGPAGGDN